MTVLRPSWPSRWANALDDKALIAMSSESIFARGVAYAQADAIEILHEDSLPTPLLRAHIQGSTRYTTEIWIEKNAIQGGCDCPHADDGWFCKHQVALALVWRSLLGGQAPALSEEAQKKLAASAKRAQTTQDKRNSLLSFLQSRDSTELAEKLMAFADIDRLIKRELQQWQKLSSNISSDADLKQLISDILAPGSGFLDYYASREYARSAAAVLPVLYQTIQTNAANSVAQCSHALKRCWRAMSHADDSNGEIGGLCVAIGEAFVSSLQAAGPQTEGFGKVYLKLLVDDPYGCFDRSAAEAAIGPQALGAFRKLLAKQWRSTKDTVLAARPKPNERQRFFTSEADYALMRLEDLHLDQLEAIGDLDAAIAILTENLHNEVSHNSLIVFLEKHTRYREAFAAAEQAYKHFPGSHMIEEAMLRGYSRDGWHQEALALLRRRFERRPDLSSYQALMHAADAAGVKSEALREELLAYIQEQENSAAAKARQSEGSNSGPNVSLRAEILGAEGRWLDACALVQPPATCHIDILQKIALTLPQTAQEQALSLLMRIFAAVMATASAPYTHALTLVSHITQRMPLERRIAWLAHLRKEYKAKRNFIRDLPGS